MQRRLNLLWAFEMAAIKIAAFVLSMHSFLPHINGALRTKKEQKGILLAIIVFFAQQAMS